MIGISLDSPAANSRFARRRGFPFPLLSDQERATALAYGACRLRTAPMAKRITYLVGADGKVEKVWSRLSPAAHSRQVLNHLQHG